MIISKKTKHNLKLLKEPCIRVQRCGHIVLNASAVKLLEIEDTNKDGVIFGYENNEIYVGYSDDVDCYKGAFKKMENSFRFGSKYEADNILSSFNIKEKNACFIISTEVQDIVIFEGYKLYKLKCQ